MKLLRTRWVLRLMAGYAALLWAMSDGGAQSGAGPEIGNALAPPEQFQPWIVPLTKLPPLAVSAIVELFNDGLPNPRGGEYREIKIPWFGDRTNDTQGWVLPEKVGSPRQAIAWNGVVYPVAAVGAPVDLHGQMAALIAKKGWRFYRNRDGWADWSTYGADAPLPIKAAFLLRLGEVPLAEAMWDKGFESNEETDEKAKNADPFANMARLWLGRWFNRGVDAYLRGEYSQAANIFHELSPAVAKAKAAAQARGIADPWPDVADGEHLWQLPTLEAEAQRRASAAPYTPALENNAPAVPPQERIARLIRDLELVSAHQMMNPGATDVSADPAVQALSKAGDDAVEPLLKCLREDDRLTRSRFTHHMQIGGPVIPVYEAAYVALFRMLNVSFPLFEGDTGNLYNARDPRHLSRAERQALADKIEAVWRKGRGIAPEEVAYRTLQDDQAGAKAWFKAVDAIVQPADGTFTAYLLVRPAVESYRIHSSREPFTPHGEALRSRVNPSVTELMIRRFQDALLQPNDESLEGVINQDTFGKFLLSLAEWDGKHCLGELRTMQQALAARFLHQPGSFNEATLVTLYEKRFDLGDRTALEDYAAYLMALTPDDLAANMSGAARHLRFLWRHPDEPAMQQAAGKLFGRRQDSVFVPLLDEEDTGHSKHLGGLVRTPLVGMPEFRQELERGLGDATVAGKVTLYKNGMFSGSPSGSSRFYLLDKLAPAAGAVVDYRVCDAYANLLAQLDGFPECQPYWPIAERDRAVGACRELLRRYGDNFRYRAGDRDLQETSRGVAPMHFPRLDHPATAEDVARGLAVFSLPGEARVCRLPELPLWAHRPSHRADPTPASTVEADGISEDTIQYTTDGQVWQAEETLIDGKWQRYYGFVGRYQLERVPAAEIEFGNRGSSESDYERVTAEINGWLESPINRRNNREFNWSFSTRDFVLPEEPLPVTVKIRNHSGLEQLVPAALLPFPVADKATAVPPGVVLSLSYSDKIPPRIWRFAEPDFDYGAWRDLPLRPEARTSTTGQPDSAVLAPAQEMTILSVDLRDYFEAVRPGSYRLKALFRAPGQKEGQSEEIIFSVAEPAR